VTLEPGASVSGVVSPDGPSLDDVELDELPEDEVTSRV
jgi:hypothetical protein